MKIFINPINIISRVREFKYWQALLFAIDELGNGISQFIFSIWEMLAKVTETLGRCFWQMFKPLRYDNEPANHMTTLW